MRLKEDGDSWNASNIIRKVAEVPSVPKYRTRKNTRRWCRGKVGVEHDPYIIDFKRTNWIIGMIIYWKCSQCGKRWIQFLKKDDND